MSEQSKVCTGCGVDKPLSDYHNDKRGRLGKQAKCKVCKSQSDKKYRDEKGEILLEQKRQYYAENKDVLLERQREYNEKNKKAISNRRSAKYRENVDENRAKKRAQYYENREKILEKRKEHYEENKAEIIKRNNKYERERRQRDPIFRLTLNTKGSVYKALKRENGGKNGSKTLDALPFTVDQLKEHLESQFDEHMSWDNYGDYWHVDHIYPLALLPYDSLEHPHFALVWDLNNLRPLNGKENISKGDEIPEIIPEHIKNFLES